MKALCGVGRLLNSYGAFVQSIGLGLSIAQLRAFQGSSQFLDSLHGVTGTRLPAHSITNTGCGRQGLLGDGED